MLGTHEGKNNCLKNNGQQMVLTLLVMKNIITNSIKIDFSFTTQVIQYFNSFTFELSYKISIYGYIEIVS